MRKQTTKILALALSALVITGMSGCGQKSVPDTTADTVAETTQEAPAETAAETQAAETVAAEDAIPTEPVTIRYAWWGSEKRHEAMLAMIEALDSKFGRLSFFEFF